MPSGRRFKDKYAGSSPENASVVRTLFDLFSSNSLHFLFILLTIFYSSISFALLSRLDLIGNHGHV